MDMKRVGARSEVDLSVTQRHIIFPVSPTEQYSLRALSESFLNKKSGKPCHVRLTIDMRTRIIQDLQGRVFLKSHTDPRENFQRRRMNIMYLVIAQNLERSSQLRVKQLDRVRSKLATNH